MNLSKRGVSTIVALLLVIMLLLEVSSSVQESQTIDEGIHLSAGYSYLVKNDFRLNKEHPPLLKTLSAIPLLFIDEDLNSSFNSIYWDNSDQWEFAKDFLYNNTISADKLLLLGRIPIMLLSLLLGLFVFRWSKELFGPYIGIISLTLFIFSPNIIAHARYVTTDLGFTAFFFITIYYFYKYLKEPLAKFLLLTGLFFALTISSKFSGLFLVPLLPLLYFISLSKNLHKHNLKNNFKKIIKTFSTILGIGLMVIIVIYGFEFKKPIEDSLVQNLYQKQENIIKSNSLGDQDDIIQKIISITNTNTKSGELIKNFADNTRLPAFSYISGFMKLVGHNYGGHTSYLLGEYSEFGWWYYFPVAFLAKTPVSILWLLFTGIILVIWQTIKQLREKKSIKYIISKVQLHWIFLVIPPLLYFLLSLTSNLNLGLRYILVIYPFIFVISGLVFRKGIKNNKIAVKLLTTTLLIFYVTSSLLIYPHYLAYFNEVVGGPDNGPKILTDSNIDWGQDVKKLKKYLIKDNIEFVCMSYFGQANLEYYKIDYRYLPDNNKYQGLEKINCVVAISVTSLWSQEGEFSWLRELNPDKKIGYSIYIYDLRN